MATPSKLRAVYHAVIAQHTTAGGSARAYISRFDADGAVVFFTLERGGATADEDAVAQAERAAQGAGGWPLGTRAQKFDTYLRAMRDALDPDRLMNPGTLA
jgi:hypothetical protein